MAQAVLIAIGAPRVPKRSASRSPITAKAAFSYIASQSVAASASTG